MRVTFFSLLFAYEGRGIKGELSRGSFKLRDSYLEGGEMNERARLDEE